jgi:hypothetical protein
VVSTRKSTEPAPQPNPARRALLTGGAVGLAAVAGATLGGAQPASAQSDVQDVTWIVPASPPNANTDTTNIQNALTSPGVAFLAPGTFLINQTLNVPVQSNGGSLNASPFSGALIGCGPGATVLMFSGTGPAVSAHGTVDLGFSMAQGNGARIMHLTIDGSKVGSGQVSSGLDVGDQADLLVWDVTIQNFTSTGTTGASGTNPNGAVGLNINNTLTWTEKYKVWVMTNNCDNAVQLITTNTNTGASTSHMYSGDLEMHVNAGPSNINPGSTQNGLVIARQGHLMNGRLIMRGNFNYSSTGTNKGAAILLGTQSQQGHIESMYLDVYVESDQASKGDSPPPTTIAFGTNTDNVMTACHGRLQFKDGWQASTVGGLAASPGNYSFFGPVIGDPNLGSPSVDAGTGLPAIAAGCPYIYSAPTSAGLLGVLSIYPNSGDFFTFTLGAASTISIGDGGLGAPQRKTIVITQGQAGGFTVSWPHTSSPTPASPTVLWPGGTAPRMTSAAGAIDVYKLETLDGATWYGQAVQNVS